MKIREPHPQDHDAALRLWASVGRDCREGLRPRRLVRRMTRGAHFDMWPRLRDSVLDSPS